MPNHIHGIFLILGRRPLESVPPEARDGLVEEPAQPAVKLRQPSQTAGTVMRGFKSATTSHVRRLHGPGIRVWQTQYYDHVIRDEDELRSIREYIVNNPLKWELDRFFVAM
jgi:REP element-mobilizing transposase RayT